MKSDGEHQNTVHGSQFEAFRSYLNKSIDFFKQMGLFIRREVPVRISRTFQRRFLSPVPRPGKRTVVLERELAIPVERNRLGDNYPVYYQLRLGLLRFSVRLYLDARLPAETGLEFRAEARMLGAPWLDFLLEFLYKRAESRLLAALDRKASELYLEALARRPGRDDVGLPLDEYDEPDYRPEAWPTRFPSENPENFRRPFSVSAYFKRVFTGRTFPLSTPSSPGPGTKRYLRRMTIIPMPLANDDLRALLPPTFIAPARAEPVLYLTTALHAGFGTELPSGREERIYMALYCPAGLLHGNDYLEGWLPLFSTWAPCQRPTLPGDPYSIGYPFKASGLRLGLGDASRRAFWMNSYTPTRVIQARDTMPDLLAAERIILQRETDSLGIVQSQQSLDFAVNRVYFMRRTPPLQSRGAPSPVNPAAGPAPAPHVTGAASWFSRRLGVEVRETDHAYFLSSLIVTGDESVIPLHRTHFRSTGPALVGRPRLDREKVEIG